MKNAKTSNKRTTAAKRPSSHDKKTAGADRCATPSAASFENATGAIEVPMTNDYLFRAMLQDNNEVLKGLICSLLRLIPEQVSKVEITNPVELGDDIDDKEFLLDINVILNDNALINLEMQVVNGHDWTERSLSYLCRGYDNLNKGEDYIYAKPVVQIGILDYTLFPEAPEFFSTYMMKNVKSGEVYSDKLKVCVLNLTHIDIATDEDMMYHTDYWASLFKATTWEELKMLAKKDRYINEACDTVYRLTQDDMIKQRCQARQEYYFKEQRVERYREEIKKKDEELKEKDAALEQKDAALKQQKSALEQKDAALEQQKTELEQKDAIIADLKRRLAAKQ